MPHRNVSTVEVSMAKILGYQPAGKELCSTQMTVLKALNAMPRVIGAHSLVGAVPQKPRA